MIIVTGAAGFIGSNLVSELNAAGYNDIILVDWLESGEKWKNISKCKFEDFVFPENLLEYLHNMKGTVEAVFHLGAISSTTARDGDEILRKNLLYSMGLWRWCAKHRVAFFYASSAATYGDGSNSFDDKAAIDNLRPLNLYGWSKHSFDVWAYQQVANGNAPPNWAGFKFFNVYGPNEYHKDDMMSLVAKNYHRVVAGETVNLFKSYVPEYADGQQLRDFVYVKDCCKIMLWFLQQSRANGIYNVGSGVARSFTDLVEAMAAALKLRPKIAFVPMPESIREKYQYFTQADMTKLRDAGYAGQMFSLESGVADYINSYLNTADRYI